MVSYRDQLAKIGIAPSAPVSYRGFHSPPNSLRETMRWMDMPRSFQQVTERNVDEYWTDECQGVAFTGTHWAFTSNNGSNKRILTIPPASTLSDGAIVSQIKIDKALTGAEVYHVGALFYHRGRIYVDHFNSSGSQALVFQVAPDGQLKYERWFTLDRVNPAERVNLVAIHPQDGTLYLVADDNPHKAYLYIHDAQGHFTGRTMHLNPPITDGGYAQGGCFSPNGHLYMASGKTGLASVQYIYCYSALNGHQMGRFPVVTESGSDELEGICFADIVRNGQRAQIHAIMLENITVAKDDIFFKSFAASDPDLA